MFINVDRNKKFYYFKRLSNTVFKLTCENIKFFEKFQTK